MRKSSLSLDEIPAKAHAWCRDLGFKVESAFEPSGDEAMFPNRVVLKGDDAGWLAANRGAGLDALQYLVHEAQGERDEDKLAYLDANGMRLFRMKEMKAMAEMAAGKAREFGAYTFQSLTPRERRWVHMSISRHGDLGTESEGTGTMKALKVFKKG